MPSEPSSNRALYAWLLGGGAVWLTYRGVADGSLLMLSLAPPLALAGYGLARRSSWARVLAAGTMGGMIASIIATRLLLAVETSWLHWGGLALGITGVLDLIFMDVTEEEERRAWARYDQELEEEVRVLRASLTHEIDQAEAQFFEKGARAVELAEAFHADQTHSGLFDHCEEERCARVRRIRDRMAERQRRHDERGSSET